MAWQCLHDRYVSSNTYMRQSSKSLRLGRLLQAVAALQKIEEAFLVCQMTMSQRNKVLAAMVPSNVNGDERLLGHLQHAATGELL